MSDLKKLRELAGRTGFTKVELTDSSSDLWLCYATEPDTSSGEFIAEFASKADANYFAAANPETVIALIDRIEKLEATIARQTRVIEKLKLAVTDIANKNTCWRLYEIDKYKSYEDGWEGVAEFAGIVLNELEAIEQGEGM